MGLENDFARLIDRAPRVECVRCAVEMRLRTLVPVVEKRNTEQHIAGRIAGQISSVCFRSHRLCSSARSNLIVAELSDE